MSSKVPTDDCFADLLMGDSALLLYYNKSRTRSRNYVIVQVPDLSIFMFVFDFLCQGFKMVVAMESWDWARWQLPMRH